MKNKFLKFIGLTLCFVTMSVSLCSCGMEDILNDVMDFIEVEDSSMDKPLSSADSGSLDDENSSENESDNSTSFIPDGETFLAPASYYLKDYEGTMTISPSTGCVHVGDTITVSADFSYSSKPSEVYSYSFSLEPISSYGKYMKIEGRSITFLGVHEELQILVQPSGIDIPFLIKITVIP